MILCILGNIVNKMSGDSPKTNPWKDGFYLMHGLPSMVWTVKGENVQNEYLVGRTSNHDNDPNCHGTFKFGDFGPAQEEVAKEAGKPNYNVQISIWNGMLTPKGIVSDDGTQIHFWGLANDVDQFEWKSEESIKALRDSGDPADAPPSVHKIQPEYQGKFLFISGAPGVGKSTTGHLLSKNHGFVYYEGDCFWMNVNPYIPPDADANNLIAALMKQNPLKGVSQDRIDAGANAETEFDNLKNGQSYDFKKLCEIWSVMAKDVIRERKRMGGDWAVVHAVPKRALRDHIRKELGPDLVFVVLHMTKEDQDKRVKGRHGDSDAGGGINDYLTDLYKVYEPATEDEPNALDIRVTPEMTPDDVVAKILDSLKQK